MKVLFATSEIAPWVKTGGLGDVAAALPPALRRATVDVRVLVPWYPAIAHAFPDAPVIAELAPSLWVKADKPHLQLMLRVVLPRNVDQASGKPLTALLRGDMYTDVGNWQQLRVPDPATLFARETIALRTQFGKEVDAREAYIDLAEAHRQAKDYDRAAENYLAAVEVYRGVDGPFTPLAIGPLTSLGDTYQEADDDVNAVASYTEARTVSRRVYGLHNEAQIDLLDRMSRSLLDLNQLAEAEAQQVEALRLVQAGT